MLCASATISGIVMMDTSVVDATMLTESSTSRPYFAANIAVLFALGTEAEIIHAVIIVPPIPTSLNTPSIIRGITISLRKVPMNTCPLSSTFTEERVIPAAKQAIENEISKLKDLKREVEEIEKERSLQGRRTQGPYGPEDLWLFQVDVAKCSLRSAALLRFCCAVRRDARSVRPYGRPKH